MEALAVLFVLVAVFGSAAALGVAIVAAIPWAVFGIVGSSSKLLVAWRNRRMSPPKPEGGELALPAEASQLRPDVVAASPSRPQPLGPPKFTAWQMAAMAACATGWLAVVFWQDAPKAVKAVALLGFVGGFLGILFIQAIRFRFGSDVAKNPEGVPPTPP